MPKQTKKAKKATPKTADLGMMAGVQGDAFKEAFERATSMSGGFGELARSNMEAMTLSLKEASKGFTEINTKAYAFMQSNMQKNMEVAKTLTSIKSAEDMTALQGVGKAQFQTYVEQMNELSGMFATTLREAANPLNEQAGAVVEKFQTSV